MCDSTVMTVIHSVASDKVGSGSMFTAFDVSLDVQRELKQRGIFDHNLHRHRHLKSDVHGVLEINILNGSYSRTLQDVGAPDPAYVYHPTGSDPTVYIPMQRNDRPAPVTPVDDGDDSNTATAVAPPPVAAPPALKNDDGRRPDARGTVCVSATALRDAGMVPADTAYVYCADHNGTPALFVSKSVPSGVSPITTYTVDSYGNVRITKFVFEFVQLVSNLYDFEVNGDQVVVLAK